jgi:hypothetical protein
MFKTLQLTSKSIISEVIELVYFMRGSIQYDDMMFRTPGERDMIGEFVSSRLKDESKRPYPVY